MKKFCFLLFMVVSCFSENTTEVLSYLPFSQTTVHISLQDNPLEDSLLLDASVFKNIPFEPSYSNKLFVSRKGDFYLNVEVDRPTKSHLTIGDIQYNIFVFPNDTTHVSLRIDQDGHLLNFYGEGKLINEYYLEKKRKLGYTDIRLEFIKSLNDVTTYDKVKEEIDRAVGRELTFLNNYPLIESLPPWFLDYEDAEIIYPGAGFKTQLPRNSEMRKLFRENFPRDYYNFLDKIKIDNANAVWSSYFFWFLDDYFLLDFPMADFTDLNGFSLKRKIASFRLNNSKNKLSGITKELYHKSKFVELIKFYSDSLVIDSLAREYELKNYKEFISVSGSRSRGDIEMLNLKSGDLIPEFFVVDASDSLLSVRDLKDQILYINFWATWCLPCLQNIPQLNKLIQNYETDSRIKFLNICIDSEKNKWLATIKRYNLMGTNVITEGNWNSKIRDNFSISGIPHYAIIKNGNILHENFTDRAPIVKGKIDALLGSVPPTN